MNPAMNIYTDQHQGFTLIELLVALLLSAFFAITVASYLTTSIQVRLIIQQERLAAAVAEDLALQIANNPALSASLSSTATPSLCQQSAPALDFSLLCSAVNHLPESSVYHQAQHIRLHWQGPRGPKKMKRPTQ